VRLGSFYERVHAPTLGTTFGIGFIALASAVFFSALQNRPVLHEFLIVVLVTLTTPVTLTILVRAALFRDRSETRTEFPNRIAGNACEPGKAGIKPGDVSAIAVLGQGAQLEYPGSENAVPPP
jgi:monovalent cation/proton antiporter MnhG/PhaG subunit